MRGKGYLALFTILIGLQGCTSPPPVKINPVELPQYGLDFRVILDKEIYQVGESVIIGMKVKNMWNKPRTLRLLPDNKYQLSFEYALKFTFPTIRYSSGSTITLNIPPMREVQINEMTWVWDQIDNWLKEPVPIGHYFFEAPRLFNVEIDGQSIGYVWVKVDEGVLNGVVKTFGFKIIHPIFEKLENIGIKFLLWVSVLKGSINIQIELINQSKQYQTVSVKPIGINPTVRVRILGPTSEEIPLLRAVYEFKETLSATIPPNGTTVAMEVIWDFRDQTTSMLVPDGLYVVVAELFGLVEVNGEIVGTIENPVKIGNFLFQKGE